MVRFPFFDIDDDDDDESGLHPLIPNEVRAILRSRPEALIGARPLDPSGTAYVTTGAIDPFAAGSIQDRFQVIAGRSGQFDAGGLYWHERFSYDTRGNRTSVQNGLGSVAYTYDPADRVRSAGNRTFTHDPDGNLIAERLGDWEVVHEYNGRNRLAHSSGNLLGWTFDSDPPTEISYTYDALDRRVSRTETTGTGWRPETHSTRYSYHGLLPQIASEVSVREGYEDDDDWERSTNDRGYSILGDSILSHVDRGRGDDDDYSNRTAWYHQDVRGSTVALSDRNGRVDAGYRYSSFGVVYGEDPTVGRLSGARPRGTEYLYTGTRLDSQTRFADFGYRDYAASLARFTSVDPIRDGRNWFAYVGGDPVNRVDVWGLDSIYATFDRESETLSTVYFVENEDGVFTGTVIEREYQATNRVRTPEDRNFVPVPYGDTYMFPDEFPTGRFNLGNSQPKIDPYMGPIAVPTDASREYQSYEFDPVTQTYPEARIRTGDGYYIHGGVGETTWGCIKMCDDDVAEFADAVDAARGSGGNAVLRVTGEKED